MPDDPVLLTVPDVMARLRFSRSKVYNLMRSGALESKKSGGSRRVPASALGAFVASLDGGEY